MRDMPEETPLIDLLRSIPKELRLEDVSFLGFVYPEVRFRITPDLKFILIR